MHEESTVIRGVTTWGIVTIILGVLAMAMPLMTGLAITLLVGGVLFVSGIVQTIYAFHAGSLGRGILRLLFGGISVLAGIVIVAQPELALATLTLFLAAYFVVDGIMAIAMSFLVKRGKGWCIFNGAITLLLGIIVWRGWPESTAVVVGILVGIRLVLSGMTMLVIGSVGRQLSEAR